MAIIWLADIIQSLFILEDMQGYDSLWFLGGNFLATTYHEHFKLAEGSSYIKDNFEVIRWFKFTLKPPNSMACRNFFSAI